MTATSVTASRSGARIERLPLARFTTLGVGGEAEVWFVGNHEQLAEALEQPYRVLGGGSNLVVADEGVPERVIRLTGPLAEADLTPDPELSDAETVVTGWVGGGVPLPGLIRKLQKLGLSNLEGTVGIPAQVGGAVWMNAGTRYGEMFGGLHTLEIVTPGGTRQVTPDELDWGYRRSGLSRGHVVSRVRLKLRRSDPEEVRARMDFADQARKGQPKMKTPGCAFKNPGGVSAGRLIDEAGLKGTRIGGALIAPEHGNFIVNLGGASSRDVHALLDLIRERVGVPLELEYELWPEQG
ncbi:UDP-N-acetylmuramate dehydrogenase [Deinococcus metallilatus]|uniref:UDP-N-acetylenolpyruvoylglucosamine reductase n=1 Tax=Deinococcus metallilatus TaxID=1211322 RepID=A0AAJ5F635_9DEIO|nr:UDP-N-acetylmuramate dehydrogenase [Deinococcus metallilatus]MBB5295932.1 UDP-N-acetylmuramate dehydrogenase [Deinococcus metallilatus]QBY08236.1 UDP-N-acetylmuramate dehydrogenase [Deinococcus metallilatus]RXJ11967.1 UDP-N-acetylmuramate dehydrogenase [Deinococcus metallilatus]TLK25801.1 UDP-N-acetylmuramate dehydrogenase [Deinococcus metallilatus]GMA14533.1 UDP-N-acetylenolpyruvoylglucosamine reductase [Deinococcus metallilatus]